VQEWGRGRRLRLATTDNGGLDRIQLEYFIFVCPGLAGDARLRSQKNAAFALVVAS
jgi:hypothetical protein